MPITAIDAPAPITDLQPPLPSPFVVTEGVVVPAGVVVPEGVVVMSGFVVTAGVVVVSGSPEPSFSHFA